MSRISDLIKHDHMELRQYYDKMNEKNLSHDQKTRWQNQFVWELARHSIGEELVLYPTFEKKLSNGKEFADKDRAEHQKVKEALYEFQKTSSTHENFHQLLERVMNPLSKHMEDEETHDLPALEDKLTHEDSISLAKKFNRTKHFVPTHSHPSAPDKPPILESAVGLLTAPIDKLMDMFKKFPEDK